LRPGGIGDDDFGERSDVENRLRGLSDRGRIGNESGFEPIGAVTLDAVAAVGHDQPQFLSAAHVDRDAASRCILPHEPAFESELIVGKHLELDRSMAARLCLDTDKGLKPAKFAGQVHDDLTCRVMAQTPGILAAIHDQRLGLLTGLVSGLVDSQFAPLLLDVEEAVLHVSEVGFALSLGRPGAAESDQNATKEADFAGHCPTSLEQESERCFVVQIACPPMQAVRPARQDAAIISGHGRTVKPDRKVAMPPRKPRMRVASSTLEGCSTTWTVATKATRPDCRAIETASRPSLRQNGGSLYW